MVVSVRLEHSFAPCVRLLFCYRISVRKFCCLWLSFFRVWQRVRNWTTAGMILLCCSVVVACGGGFHLQVGAFGFSDLRFFYSLSSLMVVFRRCAWSDTKGWSSSCPCVGLPMAARGGCRPALCVHLGAWGLALLLEGDCRFDSGALRCRLFLLSSLRYVAFNGSSAAPLCVVWCQFSVRYLC